MAQFSDKILRYEEYGDKGFEVHCRVRISDIVDDRKLLTVLERDMLFLAFDLRNAILRAREEIRAADS